MLRLIGLVALGWCLGFAAFIFAESVKPEVSADVTTLAHEEAGLDGK